MRLTRGHGGGPSQAEQTLPCPGGHGLGFTGVGHSTFMRQEHQPRGREPGQPVTEGWANFKNPSRAPSSASTIALGQGRHPQGTQESRALAGPCLRKPGLRPTSRMEPMARPTPRRLVCLEEAAAGRKGSCSGPLWPEGLKASARPPKSWTCPWGSAGSRAGPAQHADPPGQPGAQGLY